MASMNFVKISKTADKNFLNLVFLARARKLTADSIIRIAKDKTTIGDRLVIELWRREGGVDLFQDPRNDLFDRFFIDSDGVISSPIGAVSENNLSTSFTKWDILLSQSIITESQLPKIIGELSSKYGVAVSEEAVRKSRMGGSEITIEI